MTRRFLAIAAILVQLAACSSGGASGTPGEGSNLDSGTDGGSADASSSDATTSDGAMHDGAAGDGAGEDGAVDGMAATCGRDAGWPSPFDAGLDAAPALTDRPQVVYGGGPVLHNATFVSVSFPTTMYPSQLEDFVATIGCTDYWKTVGADYGVGSAVAGPPLHLTEQAPASIDETAIKTWLSGKIDGHNPLFPRPAPETVYLIWYPYGTTVTQMGGTGCQDFAGFHGFTKLGDGTPVVYAVVPQCFMQGADSDVPLLIAAASHELVESATDPQPGTPGGAYGLPDDNHFVYALFKGGEVGDMCELNGDSLQYQPPGYTYWVQRMWSNRAAVQGTNPCVPADINTYFYAAPMVPDHATINKYGTHVVPVVHVPLNSTVTIPVKLVALGVTGPIRVIPSDANYNLYHSTTLLNLSFNDAGVGSDVSGNPGDTLYLNINKVGTSPNGYEGIVLYAQTGSGNSITERVTMALTTD